MGVAAYTRNKGSELHLCVPDDEMESKDYNTMTFVLVHELAHIASSTNHHNDEFKANFRKLLDLAIESGVYRYQDFRRFPRILLRDRDPSHARHPAPSPTFFTGQSST